MRQRLYTLIQKAGPNDRLSKLYDFFILTVAFLSVVPLMFKQQTPALAALDLVTVYILFADYVFHWITHDFKSRFKAPWAFAAYPFTPYALVVMLSLLPSMGLLGPAFRMLRLLRVFVVFNYSTNFRHIATVFRKERKTLVSVLFIALFYIFLSALVMFAYEGQYFETFFEALYWATTALTTVGYGDVFPVTDLGRLISMVSSLFGIAVIALPAGIVTAGFVDEIGKTGREAAPPQGALAGPGGRGPLVRLTPKVRRYALVMAVAVAMNELFALAARALDLPLWLDTTGTAFAAFMLEPAAGLLVGLADNMILALGGYGVSSLLYFAVSAAVALVAGVVPRRKGRLSPRRVALAVGLVIVLSTALSAGIDWVIHRSLVPDARWELAFRNMASAAGLGDLASYGLGYLAVKTLDTLAGTALVALFYRLWPKPPANS